MESVVEHGSSVDEARRSPLLDDAPDEAVLLKGPSHLEQRLSILKAAVSAFPVPNEAPLLAALGNAHHFALVDVSIGRQVRPLGGDALLAVG